MVFYSRLICAPFETAFSSVRAWSIWSYAYVAMVATLVITGLFGNP